MKNLFLQPIKPRENKHSDGELEMYEGMCDFVHMSGVHVYFCMIGNNNNIFILRGWHFKHTNGPRQAILVLIAYASSEGSGEPAHPRSLARTFAARSYKQWVKRNLQTESQIPGPSEWLGMRS